MALPERLPERPEDFEDNSPPTERPSWLVGAEEGAQSEQAGRERGEVRLTRLTLPEGGGPSSRAGSAPANPAPARPVAWTAAGNSIPRLTQVAPPTRRSAEPPGDDLEPIHDGPSGTVSEGLGPPAPVSMPRVTRGLEEPWWLVLGERLAGDRRLQAGILALVLLGLTVLLWPRGTHGVALREIRRNPERWEGQSVSVSGRVGDVFPLGAGYVFNLHQGRDTIVVFTRSRRPERRERVEVTGEVSAGYLDGRPRIAILETPQAPPPTAP